MNARGARYGFPPGNEYASIVTGSNSVELQAVVVRVVRPMMRCSAESAATSRKSSAEMASGHWNVLEESARPKIEVPGTVM